MEHGGWCPLCNQDPCFVIRTHPAGLCGGEGVRERKPEASGVREEWKGVGDEGKEQRKETGGKKGSKGTNESIREV